MAPIDIKDDDEARGASLLADLADVKKILFFYAEWHEPSAEGGPFDLVVKTLANQGPGEVRFYRVLAEETPSLSNKYNVTTVPTFVFLNADGSISDRIDGGEDVSRVTQCYARLSGASSIATKTLASGQTTSREQEHDTAPHVQQSLNDRLKSLINSSPIVIFQKGTPTEPKCGFSRQAIEMLNDANVSFGYFNILEDDDVRQGLKAFSDWPTYPQLYVRGELVGGLDIMKEMADEEGGLVEQLELKEFVIAKSISAPASDEKDLNERLKELINRHRIMLFMKGVPSGPRCGFSRQMVEILDSFEVSYDAFDILSDEDIRQGLKAYSDWPTYPQLYVDGELLGGLDIVKELQEGGELEETLRC
mmetsp:Transcript_1966/g.4746  ORF Transcript_1966/g.4746 Transcript_1966/m.4746 type:complete len:363 (-) Transcript_1966:28-1116(-)